jgi:hypothetical protein
MSSNAPYPCGVWEDRAELHRTLQDIGPRLIRVIAQEPIRAALRCRMGVGISPPQVHGSKPCSELQYWSGYFFFGHLRAGFFFGETPQGRRHQEFRCTFTIKCHLVIHEGLQLHTSGQNLYTILMSNRFHLLKKFAQSSLGSLVGRLV